ncbi:MAG TPA: threonine/serine exporter family protein [Kofleriaceae bacterium]|nr:threonine/serine exporter family protein [Kofleriaceae bacterium]
MDESAIGFILALGRALHRYGTPAHRLEDALRSCCDRLGLEAEVFTTPTAIIMSFGRPTELKTRMLRVEGGVLDMGKLARVDALADKVATHAMSAADGVIELEQIVASASTFGPIASAVAVGGAAASIAVFFDGGLSDVCVAGTIGLLIGLLGAFVARSSDQTRVLELIGAGFAALAAGLASAVWPTLNPSLVAIASLIILLPGHSLTVAMTELATRNLIAGTARLMSAVIVLLELVVGVAIGERLAKALVDVQQTPKLPLPEWASWAALVTASLSVAVVVQARRSQFGWILGGCAVGYIGSRAGTNWLGPEMGVLVGAFALGALSNVYARWLNRPSQVVQTPAVFLLVPGSLGFRGMSSLLDRNTMNGVETLFATFVAAIAIVAGLLVANAVVPPRRSL